MSRTRARGSSERRSDSDSAKKHFAPHLVKFLQKLLSVPKRHKESEIPFISGKRRRRKSCMIYIPPDTGYFLLFLFFSSLLFNTRACLGQTAEQQDMKLTTFTTALEALGYEYTNMMGWDGLGWWDNSYGAWWLIPRLCMIPSCIGRESLPTCL